MYLFVGYFCHLFGSTAADKLICQRVSHVAVAYHVPGLIIEGEDLCGWTEV